IDLGQIGGNFGAAPGVPLGYAAPDDRPFAGTVPIRGVFGDMANVDYYEFEWTDSPPSTTTVWQPMPVAAADALTRDYWGPPVAGNPYYHPVIATQSLSGRNVYERVAHFEARTGFTPPAYYPVRTGSHIPI